MTALSHIDELDGTSPPYWLTSYYTPEGALRQKRYLLTRRHHPRTTPILDAIGACASDEGQCLRNLTEVIEADPSLDAQVVQTRAPERGGAAEVAGEIKVYFRFHPKIRSDARRAASRLAFAVSRVDDGTGTRAAAGLLRDRILEAYTAWPLLYVSVALRPGLEVEVYYDLIRDGRQLDKTHTLSLLKRFGAGVGALDTAAAVWDTCTDVLSMPDNIAIDFHGGHDISLYAPWPETCPMDRTELTRVFTRIAAVGTRSGPVPDARIPQGPGFVPTLVPIKITPDGQALPALEEIDPVRVGDIY